MLWAARHAIAYAVLALDRLANAHDFHFASRDTIDEPNAFGSGRWHWSGFPLREWRRAAGFPLRDLQHDQVANQVGDCILASRFTARNAA